ncbi:MAG: hypothetical protein OK457_08465 [Thaumarchaeota archaeon]|nr:hypothetical protein [Nitrososphaerota archaeon]
MVNEPVPLKVMVPACTHWRSVQVEGLVTNMGPFEKHVPLGVWA